MIDHVSISVKDFARSKAFYAAVLAPLGFSVMMEPAPLVCGFGRDRKPSFWIGGRRPSYWSDAHAAGGAPVHLAFAAPSRRAVAAFHAAALAAGGKDFGGPALRPEYHPGYYGAFVLDLDGNDVEAVIHTPE